MLYLMVQKYKLCAVHCVNTVLQGPFFSEFTLAALASYLDTKERQMMFQGTPPPPVAISSLRIPTMSPRRRFQYPVVFDYIILANLPLDAHMWFCKRL
ncbi:ataxin-3 homolog isoform X2 [Gossypium hirsutum]|uniref:ubiquitinyl hydrolase 1 n=1 Tax=Gossypium hirsutum TaxID=3635 RepID=A0ABM3BJX7_GOSHI|nr:ataxin-3 homolog isoform X2 [Gossypium hirsutum]